MTYNEIYFEMQNKNLIISVNSFLLSALVMSKEVFGSQYKLKLETWKMSFFKQRDKCFFFFLLRNENNVILHHVLTDGSQRFKNV